VLATVVSVSNAAGLITPSRSTEAEGEEEYCLYPNLIYFNEVDKGGHFAAWEQPQLFSEEVRAAFKSLR